MRSYRNGYALWRKTMHALEEFIQSNELRTSEDIDFLLEAADRARQLIGDKNIQISISLLITRSIRITSRFFQGYRTNLSALLL
jgi:hypothetical protein